MVADPAVDVPGPDRDVVDPGAPVRGALFGHVVDVDLQVLERGVAVVLVGLFADQEEDVGVLWQVGKQGPDVLLEAPERVRPAGRLGGLAGDEQEGLAACPQLAEGDLPLGRVEGDVRGDRVEGVAVLCVLPGALGEILLLAPARRSVGVCAVYDLGGVGAVIGAADAGQEQKRHLGASSGEGHSALVGTASQPCDLSRPSPRSRAPGWCRARPLLRPRRRSCTSSRWGTRSRSGRPRR